MANKIDDGGPAFPWHQTVDNQDNLGMSLRDWFAGMALCGILGCIREFEGGDNKFGRAKVAYEHADAMLKARKETGE